MPLGKANVKSLSIAINEFLKPLELDTMITEIFMEGDNSSTWNLIKRFEKILLECKINPKDSYSLLWDFLKSNGKYIKDNNLLREYANFLYYVYTTQYRDKHNGYILSAYISLAVEQSTFFADNGKRIVGISRDGNTLQMTDPYPNLELVTDELDKMLKGNNGYVDFKKIKRLYSKYGYTLNNNNDMGIIGANQQAISNQFYSLLPLIDEEYIDMLPVEYHEPFSAPFSTPREWFPTSHYKEHLKSRRYMLPHKGVICSLKNAKSIKEIIFREKLYEDKIILLYKIKVTGGKYISGFYDTNLQFFSDIWLNSGTYQGYVDTHERSKALENFVLEVYARLTTDMEVRRKKNFALLITRDIDNPGFYFEDQPVMQVFRHENTSINEGDSRNGLRVPYKKEDYLQVNKFIQPYIRKLPAGASASEEAKSLARSFGYELKEGETFVRAFEKSINIRRCN